MENSQDGSLGTLICRFNIRLTQHGRLHGAGPPSTSATCTGRATAPGPTWRPAPSSAPPQARRAGGAVLGLGAGEGESAIISGLVGGAASSSTGYVLNSALTSQNMSLGAVFHEAMLGSFSGAISGGISAGRYLGSVNQAVY